MTADANRIGTASSVTFNGDTGEYFRIWVVNMALTIITLGIYSAWAKVRKLRYFYSHTLLEGGSFDFHANPKAILFGRIIALVLLGLYFGSSYIHPLGPLLVMGFIFAVVPWLVVRSRIFRMRNTSYRGIRFNFRKNYAEAFKTYYASALITIFSLGLATGQALFMRSRFAVTNSAYGKTSFDFNGDAGGFHSIFFRMIGLSILGGILLVVLMAVLSFLSPVPDQASEAEVAASMRLLVYVSYVPMLFFYMCIGIYMQVRLRNYVWSNSTLGNNSFVSSLSVRYMIYLYLSNILAIVFSLGLLTPWAQIRLAKYRAEQTTVVLADEWQKYVAADEESGSALGDEIGDAFDIEVGLGF